MQEAADAQSISDATMGAQNGKRQWLRCGITSYNCQSLGRPGRLAMLLTAIATPVIGLQGTRFPPRKETTTAAIRIHCASVERARGYKVWHWSRPLESSANDPSGVSLALLAKRFPNRCVRDVCGAEGELQGRGVFLRARCKGRFDMGYMVLYFPSGQPREN